MSINKVIVSGNLTRDAELRYTQTGKAVSNFSVAINDGYKDKETGEWLSRVSYIECVLWDKRAEALDAYLKKGLKVCVSGKLNQQMWTDSQTGKKHSKHQIVVDEIEMLRPKSEGQPLKVLAHNAQQVAEKVNVQQPSQIGLYEEDQPF